MSEPKHSEALDVLELFLDDINATGGIVLDAKGQPSGLASNKEWCDLAVTAIRCEELLKQAGRNVHLMFTINVN